VDWTLFHAVNGLLVGRDWLEDPVTAVLAISVPVYAVATVGLWTLARPYGLVHWKRATVAALLSAGLALLANQAIAHLWDRPRPFVTHPLATNLFAAPSTDPSFPSDHAAAAFAIAVAVLAFSRRAGIVFLAAATVIAASRVVLGLHYPGDVLAGATVGTLSALFVVHAARGAVDLLVRAGSAVTDPLLFRLRRAARLR
jgi:undecaprenyl-diphosphatase